MNPSVIATILAERFTTYLKAAGHDRAVASDLYVWNSLIGEAFYFPLQAAEIALRNRIDHGLRVTFGEEWWRSPLFLSVLGVPRRGMIQIVEKRLRKREIPVVTSQVVAGLSFGFWREVLKPEFDTAVWSTCFQSTFPYLPEAETLASLSEKASCVLGLRNRISHHEPIFKRDLSKDFNVVMTLLKWICPSTHDWIKPHCRVQTVLRQKPKPRPSARQTA